MAVLQEYKCPCCGGAINFDSTLQKMKCPYCDTEFEIDALQAYGDALNAERPDQTDWNAPEQEWQEGETEGLHTYLCNSCGGEIICDDTTSATACPYCGNPVVMTAQVSGGLRPDLVIPFKVDKNAAKAALQQHYKGKKLLPHVFKDENHIEEIKGLYVPVWLFDTDTDADVRYRATKVRTWSDSRYDYTETSFYSVFRSGSLGFEAVPVDGSEKMPNEMMESIEPFDLKDAVEFSPAYLAGYLADKYDVDAEQSTERANERVKTSTEQAFASTVTGFTTVTPEYTSVRFSGGKVRYALYPVWLLNTVWNDQHYKFIVNGQTGKLCGDLPIDPKLKRKYYWRTFAVGAAIAAAVQILLWLL